MTIAKINPYSSFNSGIHDGSVFKNITRTDEQQVTLVNAADGADLPWSLLKPLGFAPATGDNQASTVTTTGDAAWANYPGVTGYGWGTNPGDGGHNFLYVGLDNNKKYNLHFFGHTTLSGRVFDVTVDALPTQTLDTTNNTSGQLLFAEVSPTNGEISVVFEGNASAAGQSAISAMMLVEIQGPEIILNNPPQLGATLSGTGTNYAAQPTGPISITQGARSLPDMPITVSAWDAGAGSFNWTTNAALPGLPANGADTTPFVLTGEDVTITLPDPGA